MLDETRTKNIGSRHALEAAFGQDLTLLTGDAEMHRWLLLDAAWRCMTTRWVDHGDQPQPLPGDPPATARATTVTSKANGERVTLHAEWDDDEKSWKTTQKYAEQSALYADAEGMFHIWTGCNRRGLTSYHRLTTNEVWAGERPTRRDGWPGAYHLALRNDDARELANRVLTRLIPQRYRERLHEGGEPLRQIAERAPTGRLPSGGLGRMAAIAVLAGWTREQTEPAMRRNGLLMIVEEPELHLHPAWQRETITRLKGIEPELEGMPLQIVASTNSPLVLPSAEPIFDGGATRHWDVSVNLETGAPECREIDVYRRGTADAWLADNVFGMKSGRNAIAEAAIEDAKRICLAREPQLDEANAIDQRLRGALGEQDPFWPRWGHWIETLRKRAAGTNADERGT